MSGLGCLKDAFQLPKSMPLPTAINRVRLRAAFATFDGGEE